MFYKSFSMSELSVLDEEPQPKKSKKHKNGFHNDPLQTKTVSQLQQDLASLDKEKKKNGMSFQ